MIGIYKITSPTKMIYIGQSRNIQERFRLYKSLKCGEQPKLYNSLKKYSPSEHVFEVVCECAIGELDALEIYYIALYNSLQNGLNLKHGGHKGGAWSVESRQKLSVTLLIVGQNPEVKERRSAWQRGRKMHPDAIEKSRLANIGRKQSEQHKASNLRNNYASKGYILAFKDGIQVGEFQNTYEAERALGCQQQNISKVILGLRSHTMGYHFKRIMRESYPTSME